MNNLILYLIIGVVLITAEQIICNIIFKQRWHFIWKGIKIYWRMFNTIWTKLLFILGSILVLSLVTLIWPITLLCYIYRDYSKREEIKDSIELMKGLEESGF